MRHDPIGHGSILLVLAVWTMIPPGGTAKADAMLTPAGSAAGFRLSTFATGFPSTSFGSGPFGIAFPTTGGVLVTDAPGNVRLFPTDTDGQDASAAPVTQSYGFANAIGLAHAGGNIYMTQQGQGGVVQVNPNGTFNQSIVPGPAAPAATGIVTDPATGHLFVSTRSGSDKILDVDPIAKTASVFTNLHADGLTVDPKSHTLYTAANGDVLGFNIDTKKLVFDSGPIAGSPDGVSLGAGLLAGNLFVNNNNGSVVEVDLATHAQKLIVTGGSRGDFVTEDPNGTLLLTQTDRVLRLSPEAGGSFGTNAGGSFGNNLEATTDAVPEPTTLAVIIPGMLGLLGYDWRRRKQAV